MTAPGLPEFKNLLADAMRRRGFDDNLSKLAKYSGVPYSTLSAYRNRGTKPNFKHASTLARFLETPELVEAAGFEREAEQPPRQYSPAVRELAEILEDLDELSFDAVALVARRLHEMHSPTAPYDQAD